MSGASFSFERRAQSRKAKGGVRALFGKAPSGPEVRERLGRLLPRAWRGAEVAMTAKKITIQLDPSTPPLRIDVEADGDLIVRGKADIGPAYCDEVFERMVPVFDELSYAWADDGFDPRALALAWLADQLRAGKTRLGMPKGRWFLVDAAVQTALGPRDAAWRDAVLADPAAGRDVFAWWERGPGQFERARALLAMWHDVAWREPIEKTERATMKQVDGDLREARKANRELDLPYHAWAELAGYLGAEAERITQLRDRATGPATPLGYRRYDMLVEVGSGWSLQLPGSFLSQWEDDGERFWSSDGDRMAEVRTLETTEHDCAKLIAVAPAQHPVIAETQEPGRHARAEAHDEDNFHIVHGLVAMAPAVAILTCKGAKKDEAWALATWKSLRHDGSTSE